MRFIPTRFHGFLDYIVGVALIAAPWIFQFSEHTAATVVPVVLGVGLIVYSLLTDYELGVVRVLPMWVHNLLDIVAGVVHGSLAVDLRLRRRERQRLGAASDRRHRSRRARARHRAARAGRARRRLVRTACPRPGLGIGGEEGAAAFGRPLSFQVPSSW